MVGDPNWLYSTIAQSSAAIVAIVGGFITHSLLTLAAEKRSLVKQHEDSKQRLESLKKHGVDQTIPNIRALAESVSILEIRIKNFSYPPNLRLGIAALGFVAVVGIFLPVLFIYNQVYTDCARTAAMAAFYSGILALFAYLAVLINTLRRKNNATSKNSRHRRQRAV
jgi:hypothetical protein